MSLGLRLLLLPAAAAATALAGLRPGPAAASATGLAGLRPGGPGFAVVPNYLKPAEVELLKQDVAMLRSEGRFSVAGVGEAGTNRVADEVRRCEQCFLYPRLKHGGGGHQEARSQLYATLDSLRCSVTAASGVELDGLLTEGLFAAYPEGGYYRRHIDSMPGTPQEIRKFSFLL